MTFEPAKWYGKPRISWKDNHWVCAGKGVYGWGWKPAQAYRDWAHSHATQVRLSTKNKGSA